jgi:hypothetical protein
MYVYKNVDNFTENMERYVRRTLREGLFGWPVADCIVTMIQCGYSSPAGLSQSCPHPWIRVGERQTPPAAFLSKLFITEESSGPATMACLASLTRVCRYPTSIIWRRANLIASISVARSFAACGLVSLLTLIDFTWSHMAKLS